MAELDRMNRDGLIAGDYPAKIEEIIISGPVDFLRGDVVGVTDSGEYTLVDSTATNGSQKPIGVICDNVSIESGASAVINMYIKGEFAHRFLRYGGNDTTDTHLRRMTEIGLLVNKTKAEGGALDWQ